jgi:hypothetical protein
VDFAWTAATDGHVYLSVSDFATFENVYSLVDDGAFSLDLSTISGLADGMELYLLLGRTAGDLTDVGTHTISASSTSEQWLYATLTSDS